MPQSANDQDDYRVKYRNLKRKLKLLIYENECFQDELKKAQKKLLKVSHDKRSLLDELVKYENAESSSSDSDLTISTDTDVDIKPEIVHTKKKRTAVPDAGTSTVTNAEPKRKKRRTNNTKAVLHSRNPSNLLIDPLISSRGDGHMTSEEIERHLAAKQSLRDLLPEKTPLTVPVEMFSNEPSVIECEIMDRNACIISSSVVETDGNGLIIDLPE